jgi:hypothetical protein
LLDAGGNPKPVYERIERLLVAAGRIPNVNCRLGKGGRNPAASAVRCRLCRHIAD